MIRPAEPDEAPFLSDLALRSKAHWHYDPDFIERCRVPLTVSRNLIAESDVFVVEVDGQVAGFCCLIDEGDGVADIDMLFVDPAQIGQGLGKRLWRHAYQCARERGCHTLTVESDTNAEPFYVAMGMTRYGEVESTVQPGRMLPLLRIEIT